MRVRMRSGKRREISCGHFFGFGEERFMAMASDLGLGEDRTEQGVKEGKF